MENNEQSASRQDRFDSYSFRQIQFSKIQHESHEYDDILKATVTAFANTYTSTLYEDEYIRRSRYVDWTCFECKCKIKVAADKIMYGKPFNKRDLFCSTHRPPEDSKAFKYNYVFQKYFLAFSNYIKHIVLKNSKLTELSAWKELQNSELTFLSTAPESRSLYPKRQRPKKRQSSFRSVLEKQKSQDQ